MMTYKPTPLCMWAALGLAMAGTIAMAFVLENVYGVLPCKMCWWQRYVHMGLLGVAVIGGGGTFRGMGGQVRALWLVVIAAALAGGGIAAWQFAAQQGWLPFPPGCTGDPDTVLAAAGELLATLNQTRIVPCDRETFKLLGLSLAGWNVLLMGGVALGGLYAFKRRQPVSA